MSDVGRLVGGVKLLGYGVALKAVVNDMYASALNVVRNVSLGYDEDYTEYAWEGSVSSGEPALRWTAAIQLSDRWRCDGFSGKSRQKRR